MANVLVDDLNYDFKVPKVSDLSDSASKIPFFVTADMADTWDGLRNPSATVQDVFAKLSSGVPVTLIGVYSDQYETIAMQTEASYATKNGNAAPIVYFEKRKIGVFTYSYTMKEQNGQTVIEVTAAQE